jgi:predicted kinase
MSKLYMMIGLPGSGKSTISKRVAEANGLIRLSTDELKDMYHCQTQEARDKVYYHLIEELQVALDRGLDVVFDGLNVDSRTRRKFIADIKVNHPEVTIIGMLVVASIDQCSQRDVERKEQGGHVSGYKLFYFLSYFDPPYLEEGFDSLYIWFNDDTIKLKDILNETHQIQYDETSTLYEHLAKTAEGFDNQLTYLAAQCHDIGKTQAKYYGKHTHLHTRYGAYMFLCTDIANLYYESNLTHALDIALMIRYHDLPQQCVSHYEYLQEYERLGLPERLREPIYEIYKANHPESIAP